jgi:hypothetical protein
MIHTLLVWVAMTIASTTIITYFQARKILADIRITKTSKRILSSSVFIIHSIIGYFVMYEYYGLTLRQSILLTLLYHTVFWITFDASLNKFRGKSLFYVSDDGQDWSDVWTDKVFHVFGPEYSGYAQIIFKIILVTVLIAII